MKTNVLRRSLQYRAALGLLLLVTLLTAAAPARSARAGSSSAPAPTAPMEAIHASYLDLAGNIADLRTRVNSWKDGDENSQKIAVEKVDRIQVVLASVAWPPALTPAIDKTRAVVEPMSTALQAKDLNAAQASAKLFGDASHDLTHAFYGTWLPGVSGAQFTVMAPHAAYLDLTANVADLRSRVTSWQQGDEGSLNIAKEKVDRIRALIQHTSAFGVFAKPLTALNGAMPGVSDALAGKDPVAAQTALKGVADASHALTHDFYSWINITAGPHDADCVQASYLDLSANLADLRTRIGEWQKGDENGLNIAKEKLDRAEAVMAHVGWSDSMTPAIAKIQAALAPLRQAFEQKDLATAEQALKPIGDGSHELTHAYYGSWLPVAHSGGHMQGMGTMPMPAANSAAPAAGATVQDESQPHGHGNVPTAAPSSASNRGLVLGGFAVVNALVIGTAAVTKNRKNRRVQANATFPAEPGLEGASE